MYVSKAWGGLRGLANARPPGSAKFTNPPPETDKVGKCPAVCPRCRGWAQLELTDVKSLS